MAGKFVISLDFEKYWGVYDRKRPNQYAKNLENVDQVVVQLLDLFERYEIHATWAVVGFLFYRNQFHLKDTGLVRGEIYANKDLNPYDFVANSNLEPKNIYFAKNMITQIANTPFQEVASHTYSHYYCLESGQHAGHFKADLERFSKISRQSGYDVSTIVFPRNQVNPDYIYLLPKFGINAYRGNEDHIIYDPSANSMGKRALRFLDRYVNLSGPNSYRLGCEDEVFNVKSSRFLAPYSAVFDVLEPLRLRRIQSSLTHAARHGEIFHLWWHPHNFGMNTSKNLAFLEAILQHFRHLNDEYGMDSMSIRELVEEYKRA